MAESLIEATIKTAYRDMNPSTGNMNLAVIVGKAVVVPTFTEQPRTARLLIVTEGDERTDIVPVVTYDQDLCDIFASVKPSDRVQVVGRFERRFPQDGSRSRLQVVAKSVIVKEYTA